MIKSASCSAMTTVATPPNGPLWGGASVFVPAVAESLRRPVVVNSQLHSHARGISMKRTVLNSAIVAALAGSAAGPQMAWSQESNLEEIIVTAEFREAN